MKTFFICFVITPIIYFFLLDNSAYIKIKANEYRISIFGPTLSDLLHERINQVELKIKEAVYQHGWSNKAEFDNLLVIQWAYIDLLALDNDARHIQYQHVFKK